MKALIIEDDPEIVESVSLAFRILWPEAQLVSTHLGREGIELAESEAHNIIILDLGLPDISGFEVLKQVRFFSPVPIIILTAKGEETDIVKGLEWGANDYLTKPHSQLELLARVKAQLRGQTSSGEEMPLVCGPLSLEPSTRQLLYNGPRYADPVESRCPPSDFIQYYKAFICSVIQNRRHLCHLDHKRRFTASEVLP